jgi:ABC-2 type transport system permease protein
VLALLYLFPVIASALNPHWSRHLQQIGPMSAGLTIQVTAGLRGLPLTPWQGLGVLGLWAAGAYWPGRWRSASATRSARRLVPGKTE